ncbi:MAG: adenylate kinase [Candidatus Zixiibacteriota bacterium]|nr:MAG: adenylate kinase [candidate division Zixibacteria bacterium]
MNLVFLGPPGSGKGTQAVKLAQKLGLKHLSTGDVLRDAVKRGSELGKQAEGYMKRGELVPDGLIIGLIESMIKAGELNGGFILDGFPRTVPQALGLKEMLYNNDINLDTAILFAVDDEEIVKRLSGRWYCPKCNTGYNYPAQMPGVEGRCDKDNAQLRRRPDDDEAVVRNRLEVYKKQTKPIEDFYRGESILVEIKAQKTPDEVFEAVLKEVSSKT